MPKPITTWMANDGTKHDTQARAEAHEAAIAVRDWASSLPRWSIERLIENAREIAPLLAKIANRDDEALVVSTEEA